MHSTALKDGQTYLSTFFSPLSYALSQALATRLVPLSHHPNMSEESKKRKHGLEDTDVAPSKLDAIKKDFNVLQDKMRETPKTEKDMRDLLKSITTLGNAVRSAAKQVRYILHPLSCCY